MLKLVGIEPLSDDTFNVSIEVGNEVRTYEIKVVAPSEGDAHRIYGLQEARGLFLLLYDELTLSIAQRNKIERRLYDAVWATYFKRRKPPVLPIVLDDPGPLRPKKAGPAKSRPRARRGS